MDDDRAGRRQHASLDDRAAIDPRLAAYLEVAGGSDAEFLQRMYRLVLRRDPEPEARDVLLAKALEGTLSRAALIRDLVASEEFERVVALDDAIAHARGARQRAERPRWLQGPPGHDERVIEIPWALARYRDEARVLEVGYAYAEPAYLAALLALGARELVGVDLASREVPGMRTVVADARNLPFADGSFDVAFCISTLEHIGQDNRVYGLADERDERGRLRVLRELGRVLGRDGRLFVTVPCGERGDHGWFVEDDVRGWTRLFARSGLFIFEQEVYELGDDGWRSAPDFHPAGVGYGERGPGASAVLCAELRPGRVRNLLTRRGLAQTLRRKLARTARRLGRDR